MANKKHPSIDELESFTQRLIGHPELFEQFRKILDLSDPSTGGKGLTINSLESFLIPVIRETGRVTLKKFAERTEEHIAEDVQQDDSVQQREKKTDFLYSLRLSRGDGTHLAKFHA